MSQNVNLVPHFTSSFFRQTFKIPASVDERNILNTCVQNAIVLQRNSIIIITINNFYMIGEPVAIRDTSLGGEDKSLGDDTPCAILILEILFICMIALLFVLGSDEDKPRDVFIEWQTIENSVC